MSKVDIWMPLYIADYLADTTRLTTEHHGAYLLLLMDYWRNGALPDDDAILAQITRMSSDAWSNARSILQAFFKQCNGKWMHDRVESELEKARADKHSSHKRAKAAAEARWAKKSSEVVTSKNARSNATSNASSNAQAMPEDMLEECPSPSPSPSHNGIKEREQRASRLPDSWSPTDEQISFCRSERPDLKPMEVAARFRDYWIAQAGQKGRKADWDATWRNWVRNERRQAPPYQSAIDKRIAFAEALTGQNRERTPPEFIDIN